MKPNDTQLSSLLAAAEVPRIRATEAKYRFQILEAVIAQWEAIRPKDDTQLRRTNHALAEELADVKARLASAESGERAADQEVERLQRELDKLKADIVELNQRLHERTQAFLTKEARPPLTPAEIEHQQFEAWYDQASLDERCDAALHGWKAVLAKSTTPAS